MTAMPPAGQAMRALIVEDDTSLADMLGAILRAEGFAVTHAGSLQQACDALKALHTVAGASLPDLVLLDIHLPDGDGTTLFERWPDIRTCATVVVSAQDEETGKIAVLDAGADDYVVKPFGVGELLARIRAALRRRAPPVPAWILRSGEIELDRDNRQVTRRGTPIKLTATEFRILACLAERAGRVVTHRQLLAQVWGPDYVEHTHYLRVYVGSLRAKLEADPAAPVHVLTEIGVGYRLAEH